MHISKKGKADAIDSEVGTRIKKRRIFLGKSQKELADAAKVSIQQIQKYESGINRISGSRLYQFAKILSVPLDFFYRDTFDCYDNEEFQDKDIIMLISNFRNIRDCVVRRKIIDMTRILGE